MKNARFAKIQSLLSSIARSLKLTSAGSRFFIAMASLLCLCSFTAGAQVAAILSGTVTDPTGAAVPSATVTADNLDTGFARTTSTNQAGQYELFELPIGHYEVPAAKQ